MTKELFEKFNEQANYNLGARGNMSMMLVSALEWAKSMGKEEVASRLISNLPPSDALVHPDPRVDGLQTILTVNQEQELVEEKRLAA